MRKVEPSLMGKSGANERNESSLSNCRVQPALSKKERRVVFRIMVWKSMSVFESFNMKEKFND